MRKTSGSSYFLLLFGILLVVIVALGSGIFLLRGLRAEAEPAASDVAALVPVATLPAALDPTQAGPEPSPESAGAAAAETPPGLEAAPTVLPTDTPAPSPTPITHTVAAGEFLENVATLYGVSVDAIVAANSISDPNDIVAGTVLTIPSNTPAVVDEPVAEASPEPSPLPPENVAVVGRSFNNWPIEDYTFGTGPVPIVLVGGMHGGYEWNTVTLAYEAIDYFEQNPQAVPVSVTLHIIPNANPDGTVLVTGKYARVTGADLNREDTSEGRFNGRRVDLNRNWGCNWSETATWRDNAVDPGTEPFSEPETVALRDYLLALEPAAVIFWHSALAIAAPGECDETHPPSEELARVYGRAAGYSVQPFLAYDVTGDASDYLASQGIASASIELTDHTNIDWEKNLAGMLAVLEAFSTPEVSE